MIFKAISERKGRKECAKGAKPFSIDLLRPLRVFAPFAFGICISTAHAQDDASVAAERARLKGEREKVEAEFSAQEKACYRKFAVNDCLSAARAKRRTAIDDLRRQEIALNDAERKRKAAERRQSIEEKEQSQRQRGQGAETKPAPDADREGRAGERATGRAAQAASSARKAADHEQEVRKRQAEMAASRRQRAEEAARNAREHDERVQKANEHAAQVQQRLAGQKKPPASSLKDPE